MDANDAQRYIDEREQRAMSGQEVPLEERMRLAAAARILQQKQQAAQVANPYDEQIAQQEAQRQIEEERLKMQEENMISAEERRLNALYAERERQAIQS